MSLRYTRALQWKPRSNKCLDRFIISFVQLQNREFGYNKKNDIIFLRLPSANDVAVNTITEKMYEQSQVRLLFFIFNVFSILKGTFPVMTEEPNKTAKRSNANIYFISNNRNSEQLL